MITPKQRIEVSKMLKILKREEAYYEKLLNHMQSEIKRLEIEELEMNASLRQEQVRIDHMAEESSTKNKRKSSKDASSDCAESSSKHLKKTHDSNGTSSSSSSIQGDECSQSSQSSLSQPSLALNDSVVSSITDERYLEPLILNPSYCGNDTFVEFDD